MNGPPEETQVYVRRRGRMTAGQARALEALRERYCLPMHRSGSAQPAVESANSVPMGLEIGFGMGQALLHWAAERPTWNLYGVEVYQPGIGALLLGLEREGLPNVRVFEAPAEDVLEHGFSTASLDEVRIFFPDPWPKKRHHKRRIIQPEFAALLADRLRPGGRLWLATDWEPYAFWMLEVLEAELSLINEAGPGTFASQARDERVETRFEARGKRLGHEVWDLLYQRKR